MVQNNRIEKLTRKASELAIRLARTASSPLFLVMNTRAATKLPRIAMKATMTTYFMGNIIS